MATSNDVIKSFTIKVNTDNGKVKIDGLTKSFIQADAAIDQLTNGVKQNTTALKQQATAANQSSQATGGATAVTMEFGRVISDAPYGIRGMANNVSQMTSQFFQLATGVDAATGKQRTFGTAIKDVGRSLAGPIGILIAIQAVISAIDYFAGSMTKAKEATQDANESLKDQIQIVKLLEREFLEQNNTLEDRMGILNGLSRLDSKLSKQIKKANGDKEKEAELIKEFREQKELELKLREKEFMIKQADDKYEEAKKDQFDLSKSQTGDFAFSASAYRKAKGERNNAFNEREKQMDEYVELLKKYKVKEDVVTGGRLRTARAFKQKMFDLSKLILENEREDAKMNEKNIIAKAELEKVYADKDIRRQTQLFKDKEKLRLEHYLISIKGAKNENELRLKAEKDYADSIVLADVEKWEALASNAKLWKSKIAEIELQEEMNKRKLFADAFASSVDAAGSGNPFTDAANDPLKEAARNAQLEEIQGRLALETEGSFAYMQIKQEEADFNNMIAQQDIKTQQDKVNEMKRIQMEYVGFVGQAGMLLKNLAGESKALATAALVVEKGAAIAKVVISANAAITQRRDAHTAIPNTIPLGPYSVPNPAKAADALKLPKDVAKTKIGAGLSIANILATSLSSKGNIGGSSEGGSGGGRTFDFNLVGSTGQNQLAQETAGQLNQPVQAYVVSSNITSTQQLDSQIQSDATFGED